MKKLFVLIAVILVLGAIGLVWWSNALRPANPSDTTPKIFIVGQGVGIREIGNNLKKEGLIKDPVVFFLYIKKEGLDKKIQAGDFRLSPSMDLHRVVKELQTGSLDRWITIREGLRAEEVAEILQENFPNYTDDWVNVLKENEGYLYPDTYLIPKEADIDMIVSVLRGTFEAKVREAGLEPESTDMTNIVIMASLIERESRTDGEKPQIASVMYNRIEEGMPLQIDATAQYALGKRPGSDKWWKQPTADDLKVESPYNTYKNIGLPPGPIASPGISSIVAAANPADTNYFFYIHDESGEVHFARTVQEHNANVNRYLR